VGDDAKVPGADEERNASQRVVLGALLEFDPTPVSFDELARYLAPGLGRVEVEDALGELRAFGLVHVIAGVERREPGRPHAFADEFVLASRAAARAHVLNG
jgi:hypothetical protein